jgi:D-3-phosphoglycerate dehydrogenase
MAPAEHMAFFLYEDRPGVIGTVGTLLGEAGVNIASMEVGRQEAGGLALMGLAVDSPIPEDVIDGIVKAVGMKSARSIALLG